MKSSHLVAITILTASCGVDLDQAKAPLEPVRVTRPPEPRRVEGPGTWTGRIPVPANPSVAPVPVSRPPEARRLDGAVPWSVRIDVGPTPGAAAGGSPTGAGAPSTEAVSSVPEALPPGDALAMVEAFCRAFYRRQAECNVERAGLSEADAESQSQGSIADCVAGVRDDLQAGRLTVDPDAAARCTEDAATESCELRAWYELVWFGPWTTSECRFLLQPKPLQVGERCNAFSSVQCGDGLVCDYWSTPVGCSRCAPATPPVSPREHPSLDADKPSGSESVDMPAQPDWSDAPWPVPPLPSQEGDACARTEIRWSESYDTCNQPGLVCAQLDEQGVGYCRRLNRRVGEACLLDVPQDCMGLLYCSTSSGTPRCEARLGRGQRCDPLDAGGSSGPQCAMGDRCFGEAGRETCQMGRGSPGSACRGEDECSWVLDCIDGVCAENPSCEP